MISGELDPYPHMPPFRLPGADYEVTGQYEQNGVTVTMLSKQKLEAMDRQERLKRARREIDSFYELYYRSVAQALDNIAKQWREGIDRRMAKFITEAAQEYKNNP